MYTINTIYEGLNYFVNRLIQNYNVLSKDSQVSIGGSGGAPPAHAPSPQQDQFLSFLHMFLPKSVRVRGWRPPTGQRPPQREILDPPLVSMTVCPFNLVLLNPGFLSGFCLTDSHNANLPICT